MGQHTDRQTEFENKRERNAYDTYNNNHGYLNGTAQR